MPEQVTLILGKELKEIPCPYKVVGCSGLLEKPTETGGYNSIRLEKDRAIGTSQYLCQTCGSIFISINPRNIKITKTDKQQWKNRAVRLGILPAKKPSKLRRLILGSWA